MNAKRWSNWAGTQTCTPAAVHQPADAGEVGRIIREAAASQSTVRPLGAGHSFTPVAVTDGQRVQLDRMSGFVGSDADAGTVTLRAGTRLRAIPGILRPRGLALANQGDVDPQALAGAVSTGTHGTGLGYTGFAGMVKGFRIVGVDGEEIHAYEGAEGVAGELFRLARLSLGAFGVITELTLDAVPAFRLAADEHAEDFDEVRRTFPDRVAAVDHMEFYWFPGTDVAPVKENTRVPGIEGMESDGDPGLLGRVGEFVADEVINNAGLLAMCEAAKAVPKLTRPLNSFAAKTVSERRYVAEAHKVFVSPRRVRFSEMEYAVPLETLPEVLDEVRRTIDRHRAWVSFPLEVRAAGADDVALSTAHGRDSAYIAVHRYHREDHSDYFKLLEPIFLAAGGRPHWGKLHTLGAEQLRERYPLFDEVAALRREVDPDGVFLNDHLRDLFGA
ncbi:D-arabinono-1,4-lactone oxidase [uncultured Corynebacterium sp.]|uniref:D-arabinono-1,4-lactone oxidase n=1 Tax=uncultured Corynebacterium sp. TaxID=159447 RepID=UPI0025E65C01|nr:D-arabinono-1,4-lactone oxidase [uncultured Corynebacterium sp.]